MHKIKSKTRQIGALVAAGLLFATGAVLPALSFSSIASAAQLSTRSVTLSSAVAGQSGTSYAFTATFPTAFKSLVVDFCSNTPVVGQSCTAPTGFTAAGTTYTAGAGATSPGAGTALPSGFTLGTSANAPTATTVKIGGATTASTAGTSYSFTLNTITNPTTVGSFYVRIYTYTDATYGSSGTAYSSPTAIGTAADTGGVALSTANTINISATVQETMTFCVSGQAAAITNGCSGTSAANVVLGTGTPQVIDAAALYSNAASNQTWMQTTTNAVNGSAIYMSVANPAYTCNGLSRNGGTSCDITGSGAFGTIAAGSAKFGLNVANSSNGSGGSGTMTPNANYGPTSGSYGMGTAVTSTYGDTIASTTAPTVNTNNQLTFAATAATTTPAGIYTTSETLVATGKF